MSILLCSANSHRASSGIQILKGNAGKPVNFVAKIGNML